MAITPKIVRRAVLPCAATAAALRAQEYGALHAWGCRPAAHGPFEMSYQVKRGCFPRGFHLSETRTYGALCRGRELCGLKRKPEMGLHGLD